MMMLLKLPIEILEHVLFFCDIGDKRNIACCSKDLNAVMEAVLWRTVYMRPALLATTWHDNIFDKFRHTRALNFYPSDKKLLVQSEYHTIQPSASAFANFGYNLAMVLAAIDPHQITKLTVSYVVSDDSFNYIMKKLCFVEHMDLISVNLAKRSWENVPTGLTQLRLGGYVMSGFCNVTDEILKRILEKNQLSRFECELDISEGTEATGLSSESLRHISKAQSIKELELLLFLPPPIDLSCIGEMQNLTSLAIRAKTRLLDEQKFMFQICQNLQQLQDLVLGSLKLRDESFSKIHLLSSLKKLSIETMESLSACFIFHYIKSIRTLRELDFDGWTFRELTLGEELTDERKHELYEDIRVLNQIPKLSKITVDCHDHFDISQMIVEGLCERKKWIHQYQDYVHTFYKACT